MTCRSPARELFGVALAILVTTWLGDATAPAAGQTAGSRPVRRHLARSTGPRWEPAGFGGAGNFLSVRFDRTQPGVVYLASDVAGVFRSTDYGDHWEMRGAGLGNYEVSSLAIDPFDPNTLYAGAGALTQSSRAGMYVSHDAGLTWVHLTATATNHITFRKYRTANAIAPDPVTRGALLSGSRGNGIWRSTDSGTSWTQVLPPPSTTAAFFQELSVDDDPAGSPHPAPVSAVVFDPAAAGAVYAGLDGAGIVKSTTAGSAGSWLDASSGLPAQASVKGIAVGPAVVWAAVGASGVYRSTDGGASWQAASGNLPLAGAWISSVAAHPANPSVAWATLVTYDYPSVWKTSDGGASWSQPVSATYDPSADPTRVWIVFTTLAWFVGVDPANPDRLFWTDYWGVWRSDDGGAHWFEKVRGAQNTVVTDIVVDREHAPGVPDVVWASHMDAGLLRSNDGGATWTRVVPLTYDPALAGHFWRIVIAGSGASKVYLTTSDPWNTRVSQILRSTDGNTWTVVRQVSRPAGRWMGGAMLGLAVDPSDPQRAYASQDGGRVLTSSDGGQTWAATAGQPGDDSFTFALTVDSAGRVFAGTLLGGLWSSADRGSTWTRVLTGQSTVFNVVVAGGAVLVPSGDDANLYRSLDGGATWQRLTAFTALNDGDQVGEQGVAVAVDPADANHLLFGRTDSSHALDAGTGVVESRNGGATWNPANEGLRQLKAHTLAFGSGGTLWAGLWGGGIWKRAPGAPSLTDSVAASGPMSDGAIAPLTVDRSATVRRWMRGLR